MVEGRAHVVVDLTAVPFMDSSGLGAIIAALKKARQAHGDLRIAGANEQVITVLKLTNLDRVLRPFTTRWRKPPMDGEYPSAGSRCPRRSTCCTRCWPRRRAPTSPRWSEVDASMIEMAIIEIAGNVVQHGHPPGQVIYAFELEVHPDRIVGVLADTGSAVPDLSSIDEGLPDDLAENGRGLWLAKATLDELDYVRVGDRNTWRLVRNRTGATTRA